MLVFSCSVGGCTGGKRSGSVGYSELLISPVYLQTGSSGSCVNVSLVVLSSRIFVAVVWLNAFFVVAGILIDFDVDDVVCVEW